MTDYDDQLERALRDTPEAGTPTDRTALPEPAVRIEGRFTVYENFAATVDALDRETDRVLRYLQADLGTAAEIDERGRARLTGSFPTRRIEEAIEAFADAYVRCPACGLPDTRLVEEDGETVIRCDACGARSPAG